MPKWMKLLIGIPLGLFGFTWMFWAGVAFEHRPAGWPNYEVHYRAPGVVGALVHFDWTLRLPDGPVAKLEAQNRKLAAAAARTKVIVQKQTVLVHDADKAERAAQAQIQWRTRVVLQEIPAHVTPAVDRAYPLPLGLVRVYDAAGRGVDVSQTGIAPGQPDEAPSGVPASRAAEVMVQNIGTCTEDRERLVALQRFIAAQDQLF